jgi:preprotein translocase subunit SecB
MTAIGPFERPIPSDVLKTVADVVPSLEIRDIRLVNLSCALTAAPPSRGAVNIDLGHDVDAKMVDDDVLAVQVKYSVKAASRDSKGNPFFNLSAIFQLTYEGKNLAAFEMEKLKTFADVNGVHNAWPYFRELVQNVASRMGLPPMTVPLLKVLRPKRRAKTATPEVN